MTSEKYKVAAELAKMARLAEAGVHQADRSVIMGLTLGAAYLQKVEMENQELLAALEQVLDDLSSSTMKFPDFGVCEAAWDQAIEAIKKAGGEYE